MDDMFRRHLTPDLKDIASELSPDNRSIKMSSTPSPTISNSASTTSASRRPPQKSSLTQQRKPQKRTRTTKDQLATLEVEFNKNNAPTTAVIEQIANKINMTERFVQLWFRNRRAKIRLLEKSINYLAIQAMESGKSLGGNFVGRSSMIPYGDGQMAMGSGAERLMEECNFNMHQSEGFMGWTQFEEMQLEEMWEENWRGTTQFEEALLWRTTEQPLPGSVDSFLLGVAEEQTQFEEVLLRGTTEQPLSESEWREMQQSPVGYVKYSATDGELTKKLSGEGLKFDGRKDQEGMNCLVQKQALLLSRKTQQQNDDRLVKRLKEEGKSWINISTNFPGRTIAALKSRYSRLKPKELRKNVKLFRLEDDQLMESLRREGKSRADIKDKNFPDWTVDSLRSRYRLKSRAAKTAQHPSNHKTTPQPSKVMGNKKKHGTRQDPRVVKTLRQRR